MWIASSCTHARSPAPPCAAATSESSDRTAEALHHPRILADRRKTEERWSERGDSYSIWVEYSCEGRWAREGDWREGRNRKEERGSGRDDDGRPDGGAAERERGAEFSCCPTTLLLPPFQY
eukprot:scaffold306616_cov27-Tisochrysis_lutea.AAC.1